MAEYHIATSDISGAIYAGIGDKWIDGILWDSKSEVTSEAINAVMAHMLYKLGPDENCTAYMNKTKGGKYLRLKLEVSNTRPSWLDGEGEKDD